MSYIAGEKDQEAILQKISLLTQEHQDLDVLIQNAGKQLYEMNSLALQRAKKRKLLLKDQIAFLKSLLIPDIIA